MRRQSSGKRGGGVGGGGGGAGSGVVVVVVVGALGTRCIGADEADPEVEVNEVEDTVNGVCVRVCNCVRPCEYGCVRFWWHKTQ